MINTSSNTYYENMNINEILKSNDINNKKKFLLLLRYILIIIILLPIRIVEGLIDYLHNTRATLYVSGLFFLIIIALCFGLTQIIMQFYNQYFDFQTPII